MATKEYIDAGILPNRAGQQELKVIKLQKQIASLQQEVERYKELLLKAKCPDCDGSGVISVDTVRAVAGCCGRFLSSGECCGDPIPIPEYVQDFAPCQWCAEREALTQAQEGEG